jgi:hypothetical protein
MVAGGVILLGDGMAACKPIGTKYTADRDYFLRNLVSHGLIIFYHSLLNPRQLE